MTFPTEPTTLNDPVLTAQARFTDDTKNHTMTVLHDDGLYKHLYFRSPLNGIYWYEISTIPGLLTINGDMGTFTFARDEDMMSWFWGSRGGISPEYWAEKLVGSDMSKRYSPAVFEQSITEAFLEVSETMDSDDDRAELWAAIQEHILSDFETEFDARQALESFYHDGTVFEDTGDWSFAEFTSRYLWNLFAIVHAIRVYRSLNETAEVAA